MKLVEKDTINMKTALKTFVLAFISALRVFKLFRRVNRDKIIILAYHGVTREVQFQGLFNHAGLHVSVDRFEAQMSFLRKHYNVISLKEFLKSSKNRESVPPYSVIITFDDGYENNYTQAFAVLSRYHLTATIFLATHYIGGSDLLWADRLESLFNSEECAVSLPSESDAPETRTKTRKELLESYVAMCKRVTEDEKNSLIERLERRFEKLPSAPDYRCLNWDQVRRMHASGLVDIGSHTHNHVIMTRVTLERASEEIAISRQFIKENAGISTSLFSYPNGQHTDYNQDTHKILQEHGFECALLATEGFNRVKSFPFELKRIGIHGNTSIYGFEARMAGFHQFLSKIIRALRKN